MVSDTRINIPSKLDVSAYIATITAFFNSLANALDFSVGETVIYYKRMDALHKTVLMIIYYAMIQYATKSSAKLPQGYSEFLNWFEAKYMDIEDMSEIRGDSDINNNHKILKSFTASGIFDFYNYLISIYKSAKDRDDQLVLSTQSYIFYTELLYLLLADTAANISESPSNDATIVADYSQYSGQYRRGFITENNPRFKCTAADIPVRVKENVIYKLISDINLCIVDISAANDREFQNNQQVYQSLLSGDTDKVETEITAIEGNIVGLRGKLEDESKRRLLYKSRANDAANSIKNNPISTQGLYKDWPANISMDHVLLVIAFIAAFFAIIYFV